MEAPMQAAEAMTVAHLIRSQSLARAANTMADVTSSVEVKPREMRLPGAAIAEVARADRSTVNKRVFKE